MKPCLPSKRPSVAAALCALSVLAHAFAQEPPESGALRRLEPAVPNEDPGRPEDLFARGLDAEVWKKRLAEPDLARREQSLDALLRRARLDPLARAFLEDLARGPEGGELAWTARLALRELGRARFPLQGFAGSPFALEPLSPDPFGGMQRMQGLMNELFAQDGLGRLLLPTPGAGGPQGRSVQVEQRDGKAVLVITETLDGQENTRRYEGANVAEILAAHPELEEELGGLRAPSVPGLRRFPGRNTPDLPLVPQGRSRPLLTDRLGVVVQPLSAARARELGLEGGGLLVERTVPESYAQLIGVGAGDVLLELDGQPLHSGDDIERRMSARGADDPLTLVWLDELGQRQQKTWRAPEPAGKR